MSDGQLAALIDDEVHGIAAAPIVIPDAPVFGNMRNKRQFAVRRRRLSPPPRRGLAPSETHCSRSDLISSLLLPLCLGPVSLLSSRSHTLSGRESCGVNEQVRVRGEQLVHKEKPLAWRLCHAGVTYESATVSFAKGKEWEAAHNRQINFCTHTPRPHALGWEGAGEGGRNHRPDPLQVRQLRMLMRSPRPGHPPGHTGRGHNLGNVYNPIKIAFTSAGATAAPAGSVAGAASAAAVASVGAATAERAAAHTADVASAAADARATSAAASAAATSLPSATVPVAPLGCKPCTDKPMGWMMAKGKTPFKEACPSFGKMLGTGDKCKSSGLWRLHHYCRKSCYHNGAGYWGDTCCP